MARYDTVLTIQGSEIPRLGFGTWLITRRNATEGVRDALEIGYRHIDTARAWQGRRPTPGPAWAPDRDD